MTEGVVGAYRSRGIPHPLRATHDPRPDNRRPISFFNFSLKCPTSFFTPHRFSYTSALHATDDDWFFFAFSYFFFSGLSSSSPRYPSQRHRTLRTLPRAPSMCSKCSDCCQRKRRRRKRRDSDSPASDDDEDGGDFSDMFSGLFYYFVIVDVWLWLSRPFDRLRSFRSAVRTSYLRVRCNNNITCEMSDTRVTRVNCTLQDHNIDSFA